MVESNICLYDWVETVTFLWYWYLFFSGWQNLNRDRQYRSRPMTWVGNFFPRLVSQRVRGFICVAWLSSHLIGRVYSGMLSFMYKIMSSYLLKEHIWIESEPNPPINDMDWLTSAFEALIPLIELMRFLAAWFGQRYAGINFYEEKMYAGKVLSERSPNVSVLWFQGYLSLFVLCVLSWFILCILNSTKCSFGNILSLVNYLGSLIARGSGFSPRET